MNFILQLCKIAGAFAAIVLCMGLVSKSDMSLFNSTEVSGVSEMSMAGEEEGMTTVALDNYERSERVRPVAPAMRTRSSSNERTSSHSNSFSAPRAVESNTRPSPSRASLSEREIEQWIQLNVAQTYLEAQQKTISPGVILALGVDFLQRGTGDMSMSAAQVADYLDQVRQSAKSEAKARMKYIANSEQWFQGLNLAGFDGDHIAKIYNNYDLSAFDKQMFSRHVERKIEQDDYTIEDDALAANTENRNRDLADAYNDYASRPEVRSKLSLPSRRTEAPLSNSEVSDSRREALSIASGQSKEYDDPRQFWAILKEMIALEHDFDSWKAYQDAHPRAADREFQSRSDIMAAGGVMKITRKRGA